MTRWITADEVFDGRELRKGVAVPLSGSRLGQLLPIGEVPAADGAERVGHILSPGFFDIQVNGGGGVLFNKTPTPEGARAIARAHRAFGTTRCLPTVITDTADVLERAAAAILEAYGSDGIEGIHIEGPHISLARKGTHNPASIRPLDSHTFGIVREIRDQGIPVLITLAPEAVNKGDISRLRDMGAVVSIGHSDATFEQARAAEAEGVGLYTHLFNAMSQLENRSPGVVGAAILSDAYTSAIFDGIHVAPEALKIAISARPHRDRMIIVSDAMPTVGGPPNFDLYGQTLRLKDGRLVNAQGSLAGAHITMAESVANAVNLVDVPLVDALKMATLNPASLMGISESAKLEGSLLDHVIVLDEKLEARPMEYPIAETAAE